MAGGDLVGEEKRAAHKDGDDEAGDEAEGEDSFLHVRLLERVRMESLCGGTGPDIVTLSDDFAGMERKSYFRVTRSRQEAVLCRAGRPGCLSWCFDMTPDL